MLITIALISCLSMVCISADITENLDLYEVKYDNGQILTQAMAPGWNLGNTFEATGSETSWGNVETTKEIIQAIYDQGFKSIRIPITWNHRMDSAGNIDPDFMVRIEEVVNWSLESGLIVIVNMHHDSDWLQEMPTSGDVLVARYEKAWQQIADYFKDYPESLIFESINEPRYSDDWGEDKAIYDASVKRLNQVFHTVVRKSGGKNDKRYLMLPTLTCSSTDHRLSELTDTILALDDNRLIGTVHYYGYWPFSVNTAGQVNFDGAAVTDVDDTFKLLKKYMTDQSIPVVIGEYGLLGFDESVDMIDHSEVLKYLEYVGMKAREAGMPLMLWDNGQHFDREALAFRQEDLLQMIMTSVTESSVTSTGQLYIDLKDIKRDQIITYEDHGYVLQEVWLDDLQLSNEDYRTDTNSIVLCGDCLTSNFDQELGHKANLILKFNQGNDWLVEIRLVQEPLLKDASSKTQIMGIPMVLRGHQVDTIEVLTPSGQSGGTNSWTSYEERGYSYNVNEEYSLIELNNNLLEALHEGSTILKVHFKSGLVIAYDLYREGNRVTGSNTQEEAWELYENGEVTTEIIEISDDHRANAIGDERVQSVSANQDPVQKELVVGEEAENSDTAIYIVTIGVLVLVGIGGYIYFLKAGIIKR